MAVIPPRSQLLRLRKAELVDLLEQLRSELDVLLGPIGSEVYRALVGMGELPGFDRAKGAAALVLAGTLDSGSAGLATAGIAKELRATLAELEAAARERDGNGDPGDEFDRELAAELAGLTT